jgi:hypothetical protein
MDWPFAIMVPNFKRKPKMSAPEYPECLRELIESEIFGEAVSLALLEVVKNERERYHLASLLQLETETKARLRPLLYKHNVSLSEKMPLDHIERIVWGYINASWEEFTKANIKIVEGFLARFKEIAMIGPDEDRVVLESMIRHEQAILRWFDMESRGEKEGSLDGILAELQHPV